jgi:transcriptional regulator with XRE-family HTH domain
MKDLLEKPGIKFGCWLKEKRQSRRINARQFGGMIGLTPAEYAEVECGIVHWIKLRQELLIVTSLNSDYNEEAEFKHLLDNARAAKPLRFGDVFTRDQLRPMRLCHDQNVQLTMETSEKILDAVFTELELT